MWQLLQPCEVWCGVALGCAVYGCKQCWNCGYVLHRVCAELAKWIEGPFYYNHCLAIFGSKRLCGVTLNQEVMALVLGDC